MRNPIARALMPTVVMLAVGTFFLRSDLDVRTALLKTVASPGEAISPQRPMGHSEPTTTWEGTMGTSAEQNGKSTPKDGLAAPTPTPAPILSPSVSSHITCDFDMERLKRWQELFHLKERFEYAKRYVQATRKGILRKSITKLNQVFLPDAVRVVDVNKQYGAETCPAPLVVPVSKSPFPSTANASDFIFGVSTTYERFTEPRTSPINEWTYWLTDGKGNSNGGKLVLLLLDALDIELDDVYNKLTSTGIDVDMSRSDSTLSMASRYLTLVPRLYDHPDRSNKKWLVICDDDTFFPSFNGLVDKLAEYDHERPMYIGTLSEDVNNIHRHGSQAFGGAGVFLSVPMAKIIAENFEMCNSDGKLTEADTGWGPQGDILLRKCIYENSETRLTLLNELWQLDLLGDPAGFYESGVKPLSLHHYRGGMWHVAYPWHYTKVASICGEDCTLQRFQTADDFVISNGFSIAYYPRGIDFDLGQVEATFHAAPEDQGWNFDFVLGPRRQSLHKSGRKMSWDLQEATVNEDGSVSQVYVRKHDDWRWKNPDGTPMSEWDGIIELVWLPATQE